MRLRTRLSLSAKRKIINAVTASCREIAYMEVWRINTRNRSHASQRNKTNLTQRRGVVSSFDFNSLTRELFYDDAIAKIRTTDVQGGEKRIQFFPMF